jgi:hypothetical protein
MTRALTHLARPRASRPLIAHAQLDSSLQLGPETDPSATFAALRRALRARRANGDGRHQLIDKPRRGSAEYVLHRDDKDTNVRSALLVLIFLALKQSRPFEKIDCNLVLNHFKTLVFTDTHVNLDMFFAQSLGRDQASFRLELGLFLHLTGPLPDDFWPVRARDIRARALARALFRMRIGVFCLHLHLI